MLRGIVLGWKFTSDIEQESATKLKQGAQKGASKFQILKLPFKFNTINKSPIPAGTIDIQGIFLLLHNVSSSSPLMLLLLPHVMSPDMPYIQQKVVIGLF